MMHVTHPNVSRLKSWEFPVDLDTTPDDMAYKLRAEQERLLRILPDAPEGWYWDLEMQQCSSSFNEVLFRVVAKLKELQ